MTLFWCFYCELWIHLTSSCSVSTVDFEQVNVTWVIFITMMPFSDHFICQWKVWKDRWEIWKEPWRRGHGVSFKYMWQRNPSTLDESKNERIWIQKLQNSKCSNNSWILLIFRFINSKNIRIENSKFKANLSFLKIGFGENSNFRKRFRWSTDSPFRYSYLRFVGYNFPPLQLLFAVLGLELAINFRSMKINKIKCLISISNFSFSRKKFCKNNMTQI